MGFLLCSCFIFMFYDSLTKCEGKGLMTVNRSLISYHTQANLYTTFLSATKERTLGGIVTIKILIYNLISLRPSFQKVK